MYILYVYIFIYNIYMYDMYTYNLCFISALHAELITLVEQGIKTGTKRDFRCLKAIFAFYI